MRIAPLLPLVIPLLTAPATAGDYSICLTASQSVNCLIEQAEFEYERNTEINASIARVQRVRAFEAARNAEVAASIARVEARRQRQLEIQQNALVEASIAAANAERERRFAAKQNELATASVERVEINRKRQVALTLTHCKTRFSRTPRCLAEREQRFAARQNAIATASIERVKAERERAFAAARNAEINASIAAVASVRAASNYAGIETATVCQPYSCNPGIAGTQGAPLSAAEYAAYTSHCVRAPQSPRCEAERIREFAAARNQEISASIAAVARTRAAAEYAAYTSHCVRAPQSPRCEAERIREFADARNAEINASIAAVARNRAAQKAAEYAAYTSHCVRAPQSPRCEAQQIREFAAARNAEINASIAAVARDRATLRPAEYAAYTSHCVRAAASPRCEAERIREFAAARNAEINASIAAVARNRASQQAAACAQNDLNPGCDRQFQAARNAEINASIAAVEAQRQTEGPTIANGNGTNADTPVWRGDDNLETGALGSPLFDTTPALPETRWPHDRRSDISNDKCRHSGTPFGPLHFVRGIDINYAMKTELDRLAGLAAVCPGVRIEIHGFSDGMGVRSFANRSMAQARAQAVADYLIASGVGANRVAAIGRGNIAWVLPYSKDAAGALGRRVEFVIKDPAMDAVARRVMYDLAELLDPTYVPAVADLSP